MAGEWREMPFSEAVLVNPRVELKRGTEYPLVDMQSVNAGSRCAYASEQRSFEGGGSRFAVGDTLMARITPCLENGKIARFCAEEGDQVAHGSTEFIVIRGRDDVTLTDYAYYLTKWDNVSGYAISQMTGTSGRQRVPTESLDHVRVPIPSVPEQRAIAHILGTLDDKIELNRRMNETLEAMARAIFKSWFVDAIENVIPKGWRVAALPEVVEINPPRQLSKGQIAPYLDMQNMPTFGHRALNWINRSFGSGMRFKNGDTLVARITPCLENGKTAFVDFLEDDQVGWGSTEYIVLRPKEPLPMEYGYYLARSEDFRNHAIQNMTGTSGRQRVPVECFSKYLIAVPPETAARRFGELVKPLMKTIRSNDNQSRTLAAIRDTLLPKLLSGEIRINGRTISTQRGR
jgi:type I restriction enzyme S subunit